MDSREATPFRLGTPLHPPPPRTPARRGTPGQGEVLRQDGRRVVSQAWDGRGAAGGGWGVTSWYDEGDGSNGNGNDNGNGDGDGRGGPIVLQGGRWSSNNDAAAVAVGRMDSETLGNTTGTGTGMGMGIGQQMTRGGNARTNVRTSTRPWAPREEFRADTPNPDDGRLVRRSEGGVMRMGSGRSTGARKEVRWSKDVDYEGRG